MGGLPMAIQIEANLSPRNTRCASKPRSICSTLVENPLQNHTFLCKTKPISKSCQCPQTLLRKQLTKIFTSSATRKTKPIQSQTKPISKMTKINAKCLLQRDYEQKLAFFRQKNKANSKPISKTSKNNHKIFYNKGL